jgi:hypothetical protein
MRKPVKTGMLAPTEKLLLLLWVSVVGVVDWRRGSSPTPALGGRAATFGQAGPLVGVELYLALLGVTADCWM